MTTPFTEDSEHASWDRDAVERFGRVLDWSDAVLQEFAGWFCGKTSPVHLFWHGLDLGGWDASGFESAWHPTPSQLDDLRAGAAAQR